MAKILVVDDDLMICEMLADIVEDLGHSCKTATTVRDGIALAEAERFDVVFQDVYLPDGTGFDLLGRLKDSSGRPEVIIITGSGETAVAERAMREGAWDFVHKPLDLAGVTNPLERALSYREGQQASGGRKIVQRRGIAGSSALMRALLSNVVLAGESGASVLISGETGTGKELFARAIHANSPRAGKPFVVVDCASLPETLIESTLFGHVKGAFTGADKAREGLVKLADGGTLFLDELGELPFHVQRSFLRVLEERSFRPVGGKAELTSDFRLVAATNRRLDEMVEAGQFRKDLLYRIRSFSIELPSLRERVEDIPEIVALHMERLSERGLTCKDFSPEYFLALEAYPWPGNVRELVNCLERSLAAAQQDRTLYLKHLPDEVRVHYAKTLVQRVGGVDEDSPALDTPPLSVPSGAASADPLAHAGLLPDPVSRHWNKYREVAVSIAEREYFARILAATSGNIKESCRLAGVSRARLYQILQKHGLTRPG